MLEVTRMGDARVFPQPRPHSRPLWSSSQLVQECTARAGGKPCRQPVWGHCDMLVRGCRSWQGAMAEWQVDTLLSRGSHSSVPPGHH